MSEQKQPCLPECRCDTCEGEGGHAPTDHNYRAGFHAPGCPNAPGAAEARYCNCPPDDHTRACQERMEQMADDYAESRTKPAPAPLDGKFCPHCHLPANECRYQTPAPEPQAEDRTLAHKHIGCQTCDEKHIAHLALKAENAALFAGEAKSREIRLELQKQSWANRKLAVDLEADRDALAAKLAIERKHSEDLEIKLAEVEKERARLENLLVRMQTAEAWTSGPWKEASEAATAIRARRKEADRG